MSSDRTFYFIAVNYNNSSFTLSYIESLIATGRNDFKIIIIDNDSQQDDFEILKAFSDKIDSVLVLRNDKNIGYFPALNVGLENIVRKENDYVIIGNNDLFFQLDFISTLDRLSFNENILVVAPNIIRPNNVHQNPHIIDKFNRIEKIYRKAYFTNYYISIILQFIYFKIKLLRGGSDRRDYDKIMPILMGYGACYILTPNFFNHYTILDAPVFLMGEEGILADQILRAGGITLYHPELIVNHNDHTSIGNIPSKALYKYSQISYRYFMKNCNFVSE